MVTVMHRCIGIRWDDAPYFMQSDVPPALDVPPISNLALSVFVSIAFRCQEAGECRPSAVLWTQVQALDQFLTCSLANANPWDIQ